MADKKHTSEIPDPRRNLFVMRERAKMLRHAADGAKLNQADQVQVAENLWGILAEAERRGIRRAEVLLKAGKGSKADSTKRLERYALDPTLPAEKRKRRVMNLTKGAGPYLEIAQAAGHLVDGDADVFVADLFARTCIGEATQTAPEADDIYTELADLVRDICRGIGQKHDLTACARQIETWRICRFDNALRECRWVDWNSVWQGIGTGARVRGLVEREGGWSLPYPNVLVGWGLVDDDIPFRVAKEPKHSADGLGRTPLVAHDGKPVRRLGNLLVEVRIALLPVGPGGSVEPTFVTQLRTHIKLGHVTRGADDRLRYSAHTDTSLLFTVADKAPYIGKAPELADVWSDVDRGGLPATIYHRTNSDDHDLVFELDAEAGAYAGLLEKYEGTGDPRVLADDETGGEIQHIELVSPASCRKLLSLRAGESPKTHVEFGNVADDTDPCLSRLENWLDYWWERRTDLLNLRDEYASRATPFTLGEVLEYALLFANKNDSFDTVLDRTCARVVQEIAERAGSLAGHREERKALKRSIWAQEPGSD